MSLTPEFVAPGDEVLFKRAVENCKEREWLTLHLSRQACEFKDPKDIERAVSKEKRAASEEYVWMQAHSKMDFINEATEVLFGLLAFALTIVLRKGYLASHQGVNTARARVCERILNIRTAGVESRSISIRGISTA